MSTWKDQEKGKEKGKRELIREPKCTCDVCEIVLNTYQMVFSLPWLLSSLGNFDRGKDHPRDAASLN